MIRALIALYGMCVHKTHSKSSTRNILFVYLFKFPHAHTETLSFWLQRIELFVFPPASILNEHEVEWKHENELFKRGQCRPFFYGFFADYSWPAQGIPIDDKFNYGNKYHVCLEFICFVHKKAANSPTFVIPTKRRQKRMKNVQRIPNGTPNGFHDFLLLIRLQCIWSMIHFKWCINLR